MINFFFDFLDRAFMMVIIVAVFAFSIICVAGPIVLALFFSPWWVLLYFISIPLMDTVMDIFT